MGVTFFLLYLLVAVQGAKILGVFHNPSKSHFHLGNTLLEALAKKGHEVTMLAPYKVSTALENYESVEVAGLQSSKDEAVERLKMTINGSAVEKLMGLAKNFHRINTLFLDHPTVKTLLASGRQFDLVVVDWVFNDAFLGFAHHFGAHSVVFSSFSTSPLVNKITGNPSPLSYVATILPPLADEMTFLQRVSNVLVTAFYYTAEFLVLRPANDWLLHEHFPQAPHLTDLLANVSLVLVNAHFTSETPRPYVPNMIPIGGFHLKEPKGLEGELKEFMDRAADGVVYCSFGSIIKSSEIGQEKLDAIVKVFAKLPYKVLWKFESDRVSTLPANVLVKKWFPQSEVLAHPNLKVFITHGGSLSKYETLYHGVPMIIVPFFGDQESNAEHSVSRGYAIKIKYADLNEDTLSTGLNATLYNPKYRETAKEHSRWFKDRPVHPLDHAVYWMEYVLRHKGAHHLKTKANKLNFYQYNLLDVYAFLGATLLAVYFLLKTFFKFVLSGILNPKEKTE